MALELKVEGQLVVDNGAAKALETHSTDEVDFPKQSSARAYTGANQDIPQATTQLQLDTESWDLNDDFDTGNYKFVAPKAGKYLVIGTVRYQEAFDNGQYATCKLYKEGALVYLTHETLGLAGFTPSIQCSAIIDLAATDEVTLYTSHSYVGGDNKRLAKGYLEVTKIV